MRALSAKVSEGCLKRLYRSESADIEVKSAYIEVESADIEVKSVDICCNAVVRYSFCGGPEDIH